MELAEKWKRYDEKNGGARLQQLTDQQEEGTGERAKTGQDIEP